MDARNCPNSADWSRILIAFGMHQPMARSAEKQVAAIKLLIFTQN
jgi:hypothetical protein